MPSNGGGADAQEGHDGRPALAPLPGPFPGRRRPGVDRLAVEEAAQVVGQLRGAGVAPGGLLFQALQADRLQVVRDARLELARRHRLLLDDLADGVDRVAGLERRPAGEQLVEDRAQRVDVGGRADVAGLARGLFRGHVAGGAEDGAALGLPRVVVDALGQAEIGDLGDGGPRPVVGGQRVDRQMPLCGAPTTGRRPGRGGCCAGLRSRWTMPRWWATSIVRGQRLHQLGGRPGRRRTLAQALFEAAPLHELQREVGPPFVLAGLVDLDDVGVLQPGDGLGLGAEPGQAGRPGVAPA